MNSISARRSLLAAVSMAATAGASLTGTSAFAAAPASSGPPVATETLSAPGVTPDAQGNLTAALSSTGSLAVAVGYNAAPAPGSEPSGTPGPSATLSCGQPGGTLITMPPLSQFGFGGSASCVYNAPGTYQVTFTVNDGLTPAQTASATHTVTVTPMVAIPVNRYDGASRFGTGVAVSRAAFPAAGSANAVILARGDQFADALAGIPLAKAKNGPLLLTPGGAGAAGLDPNVEAEILRVLPKDKNHTVYVLGGVGAIPQPVADQISALGYNVVRLAGGTRFDTALAIARDPRALNNPRHVVLARGDDFADALAAGPFAANAFQDSQGSPAAIVLSDGPRAHATVDPATGNYLKSKMAAPEDQGTAQPTTAVGNVATVGGGAEAAVYELCVQHSPSTPTCSGRFATYTGSDRFETARLVAMESWQARSPGPNGGRFFFQAPQVGLATGLNFADALTGGAYMALKNGPLLLTGAGDLEPAAVVALRADVGTDKLAAISVFGGPSVLSNEVVNIDIGSALRPAPIAYADHHVMF
ncbi:MAG: cell wall-binding repeat-containing protein [Catenulispora sp.]